jgi:hypothetical protein
MKKSIILICSFVLAVFTAHAQDNPLIQGAKVKQLTPAEANALNGSKEPTVNGKPYSQHKAEQDALKRQQQNQAKPVLPAGLSIASNTGVVEQAVPKPAESKAYEGYKQPETKKVEAAVVKADTKPAPEAFKSPTQEQWGAMTERPVQTAVASADPSAKQSKANMTAVATKQDVPVTSAMEKIQSEPQPTKPAATEVDKPKQPAATPEVPAQFRLSGTAQSWTGRAIESKVTTTGDPAQSTDAPIAATDMNAYKAQQTANQKASAADVIAKPKTVDASVVTTKEAKSNPAPEVPAQFKLNTESWNGGAVAAQSAVVRSEAAQSIDAKVGSEQFKSPSMDRTNKETGDEGKLPSKPETKKVDASLVSNAASKQADPAGLAIGKHATGVAPAAQTQMNTKGTSLDPAAKATAPAGTVGQEGGGNPTPVPANTVKAPVKDKDAAPAPALPSNAANPAGNNGPAGNSTSPAPVVPVENSKQGTEKPASKE